MAGYWLKLYTEILDDPKYYRLSEIAKVGMYEIMMVAKKNDQNGDLPSMDDICFYTRRNKDWWDEAIIELKIINFIIEENGVMKIRTFAERQKAVDAKERKRQSRIAKQKCEYQEFIGHETVTTKSKSVSESRRRQDVDKDIDKDLDGDEDVEVSPGGDSNDHLLTTFCRISCLPIPAVKAIRDTWTEQLIDLKARGVTENIIRRACKELTEKGTYRITSPKSIVKACDVVMAEKKRKDDEGYVPIGKDSPYSEAVLR